MAYYQKQLLQHIFLYKLLIFLEKLALKIIK
jgi:hypothetical protein